MDSSDHIICSQCDRQFRFKPELAGKQVKCICGNMVTIEAPRMPATDPHDTEYDLAEAPATPDTIAHDQFKPACPSCGSAVKAQAVICLNCGYNFKEGKAVTTEVSAVEVDDESTPDAAPASPPPADTQAAMLPPTGTGASISPSAKLDLTAAIDGQVQSAQRFKDITLPLIYAGTGVLLIIVKCFVLAILGDNVRLAAAFLGRDVVTFVIDLPFLFLGLFLTARMFGTEYGSILWGILKIAAIVILATGVESIYVMITGGNTIPFGWVLKWSMYLLAFYIGCVSLFDMEPFEVAVLWLVSFFAPKIVIFLLLMLGIGYFMA
jgi:hypothetical protein